MEGKKFSDYKWERNFSAAKQYFEENGNLACKSNYVTPDGIKLGFWLCNIRAAAAGSSRIILTDERKAQLDAIGMVWDTRSYAWEEHFSEAQSYYQEHKKLNVPSNFVSESGFQLGLWIFKLRKNYIRNELSEEKIKRLESIGMLWMNRFDIKWHSFYEQAKAFYEEYGHLQVPSVYATEENLRLGRWIICQRDAYQKGTLEGKKIILLNDIGMIWDKANSWEKRYALARQYYAEHGNIDISQHTVVDGVWLGKWLSEQKKKEKLTAQQIMMLEEIGMQW